MTAQIPRTILADLADPEIFDDCFAFSQKLGKGSDGEVSSYLHRSTGRVIAVKTSREYFWSSEAIHDEIDAQIFMSDYGKHLHQNIAHMLACHREFGDTLSPAIFFEQAEFGDLITYRNAWLEQDYASDCPCNIPEAMVWKLFKDMMLALDYLHNHCSFIHRDVKSQNILVFLPPHADSSLIPTLPVFKLCDFSRAVAYAFPKGQVRGWAGTQDYAPPFSERRTNDPARPSGDMWSLGATLQEFALGILPVQSREAHIAQMDQRFELHPKLVGDEARWKQPEWDIKFSAMYRPLNASVKTLMNWWDVSRPLSRSYKPFSDELNTWYRRLFDTNWQLRATAAILVKHLLPIIDVYIGTEPWLPKNRRTDSVLATQYGAPPPVGARGAEIKKAHVRARYYAAMQDYKASYEGNAYPLS